MAQYRIDLPEDIDQLIARLASDNRVKKEDIISNAVASYMILHRELNKEAGRTVAILDQSGDIVTTVSLPYIYLRPEMKR